MGAMSAAQDIGVCKNYARKERFTTKASKKHEEKQRSGCEIRPSWYHLTGEDQGSRIALNFFVLFVLFVSFVVQLPD